MRGAHSFHRPQRGLVLVQDRGKCISGYAPDVYGIGEVASTQADDAVVDGGVRRVEARHLVGRRLSLQPLREFIEGEQPVGQLR